MGRCTDKEKEPEKGKLEGKSQKQAFRNRPQTEDVAAPTETEGVKNWLELAF